MFRMYPEERVFMDGRNDLYTTFRRDVWLPIHDAAPGFRDRLAEATGRWELGWLLLDADAPLARAVEGEPGWLAPLFHGPTAPPPWPAGLRTAGRESASPGQPFPGRLHQQ